MITSLIQRCKFRDSQNKMGVDSILAFDYMGSIEFEYGALSNSLKQIRAEISEYTYMDVPIENKVVTVFCHSKHKSEIRQYLKDLAVNKFVLQEYSDFNNFIDPKYCKCYTDCWWDIENHLFFWPKNNQFEIKFKSEITAKPIPKPMFNS